MPIEDITGQVGLGGEAGFQIQQNIAPEAYEVITKALVTDEATQELKLLIATSRNSSASSVLGTMAIDVFPLQGRPHLKELVAPHLNLTSSTSIVSSVKILSTSTLGTINIGQTMPEIVFSATGGTAPYSWFSNNLPTGLFLDIDGTLHGTPLVLGTHYINVAVADSSTPAYIATQVFTLAISSNLTLPGPYTFPANHAIIGEQYSQAVTVTGGNPPYTWAIDATKGDPPIGISISSDGILNGWPVSYNSTEDFSTPFTFWVIVSDSLGAETTQEYTLQLQGVPLTLGQADAQNVYLGNPTKIAIPIFGGIAPYSLSSVSINIEQSPVFKSPFKISF